MIIVLLIFGTQTFGVQLILKGISFLITALELYEYSSSGHFH